MERFSRRAKQFCVPFQACPPSGDLLGEPDRGCVLQVGPSAFQDISIFRFQPAQCFRQFLQCGKHPFLDGHGRGNMQCRGKRVVGGLAHIYVIVGVEQLLPRDLIAPVCEHLVHIHVALGAASGLPYHQGKVLLQGAGADFFRRRADRGAFLFSHPVRPQLPVCPGCRCLQHGESMDDFLRHRFLPPADRKIVPASLCLGTPVPVRRYAHLAQGVMLRSVFLFCHLHPPPR